MKRITVIILVALSPMIRSMAEFNVPVTEFQTNHLLSSGYGNPDTTYLRKLKKIEHILTTEIPGYGFTNHEGVPSGYLIADLTDSLNIGKRFPGDERRFIKIIDHHFYYIVPALKNISYGFIIYFSKRTIKTFKYVNCKKRGDSLKDAIEFAAITLFDNKDKAGIINRIRNCRYSVEFPMQTDNYSVSEPFDCN